MAVLALQCSEIVLEAFAGFAPVRMELAQPLLRDENAGPPQSEKVLATVLLPLDQVGLFEDGDVAMYRRQRQILLPGKLGNGCRRYIATSPSSKRPT